MNHVHWEANVLKMIHLSSHVLFACFLTGCASTNHIITTVGRDVTLTCTYDAKSYGRLTVCWGRGDLPNRGCANEVLKSDGTSVISRLSERYLLMGDLENGDVSLTIRQAEESDSGTYGCRVDIPGWFNDEKYHLTLTVNAARPAPLRIEAREVKERTITVRWISAFDGGRPITNYVIDFKNKYASWDTATRIDMSQPHLTQATLVDLRPYKTYNIRMFAVNNVGMSDSSNVLTLTTKEAAPEGPPLDMKLEPLSSDSIKVSWKPPKAELRNGVLRGYAVSYRQYDDVGQQFQKWHHFSVAVTGEQERAVLRNLKPSSKYGVLVQAKTTAGIGPASTAPLCSTLEAPKTTASTGISPTSAGPHPTSLTSVFATSEAATSPAATYWEETDTTFISVSPLVCPDPPIVKVKEVKNNTISLFWTPGISGGDLITGYYLEYKAASASWDNTKNVVDFPPDQFEATIIEMNPSTYNIRMFARSGQGTSKASNVLTVTTGEEGHQSDILIATISTNTAVPTGGGGHPAAIAVPLVLVLLAGSVVTWQLLRLKQKKYTLTMWLTGGALRYNGAESLREM